jgi:uncharacterized protein
MIKVKVRDIRPEGIEITDQMTLEELGVQDSDYLRFIVPWEIKVKMERVQDALIARTHVKSKYTTFCSRCLEPLEENFTRDIILHFEIDRNAEFVEVGEDIRQEVFLSLPMKFLCREDCKGICPGCGKILNLEACQCKKTKQKS